MPNHTTISTAQYRVEIHPAFDLWMRGARFGTVLREYKGKGGVNYVAVLMDHPQAPRPFRCPADTVKVL